MAIKLTKNELKVQKDKLKQFERYLPTLQLKTAAAKRDFSGSGRAGEKGRGAGEHAGCPGELDGGVCRK